MKKKWMVGYWNQRGNEKSLRNEHGNDKFLKIKYKLSIMSERSWINDLAVSARFFHLSKRSAATLGEGVLRA